ncbi:amidase [Brevibacterium aurantiacum]|uniref:Amidase n=1 Tax=Brevibacterium aurantiacum TaxID=273384 RepID=A0A2H1J8L9_BREAU|nr:amidase family protein [Brevibacterium aurantiacum]SMX83714.1 amidase [Brevibacterium aurantiacum]
MALAELAGALATGQLSSRELVEAHLRRIDEINPLVNAVVTVDADRALASANKVDELRARGTDLPLLSGIPMTHKDTHETAGMRTTYGSPIFADNVPNRDDLIVARLKSAGVISTGKSNVPEFAAGAHTVNPVFGTTRNPYDLTRSASGSSGGAAATIACGVQAAGDGSDTGGSLRLPAAFNNIVGLRPSNGWIPHVVPGNPWEWLSQPGFMARNVADVALLMDLCSGPDTWGPTSRLDLGQFSDLDTTTDLSGWRIGFAPDLNGQVEVEGEVAEVVGNSETVLTGLGAQLSHEAPALDDAAEVFRLARAYEFAKNYGHLIVDHADQMKSTLRGNIQAGLDLGAEDLFALDAARARLWVAMQDYFSRHDVLVTTTSQVKPFDAELDYPDALNGKPISDYMAWVHATSLISATGCPAISVPAGFSATGLPVGLQFIGPVGADARVLKVAQAFERVTNHAQTHPPL